MRAARVAFRAGRRSGLRTCSPRIRRGVCAAHLGLIAVLSLVPAWLFPPTVAQVPGIDKWAHLGMYGVLGALFRWAAGTGRRGGTLPAAGIAYGLLMELLQMWIGGGTRMFSWGDVAANAAGVGAGWVWTAWALGRDKSPAG